MELFIFIFYLGLFCFVVVRLPFFRNSGLLPKELVGLFLLKVLAGFAYAKFYQLPKYYAGADTWRFYKLSLAEKDWLLSNPVAFVKDLFVHGYSRSGNLFAGENSYWNDLKSNVPVKLLAVCNVFTFNSYYANIILFNFLFLFGLVALYKLFREEFKGKKLLIVAGVFLLPSTLFWCSGIHKDGLLLSALGLTIFLFYRGLNSRFSGTRIILLALLLLLIFSLRNYVVVALLPALFCWAVSTRYPRKTLLIYGSTYLLGIALFFTLPYITSALNLPAFLVNKQQEFLQLQGGSSIKVSTLQPNIISFIKYLPTALDMAFLQPHFSLKSIAYIPAAAEALFVLLVVALTIIRGKFTATSTCLFLLFFSISILLVAGYTITFSGAIVRYKAVVLPLLLTPLFCLFTRERTETYYK